MSLMNNDSLRYFGFIDGGGDPITSKWPLVTCVTYPAITIVLYLIMVVWGKNKTPTKGIIHPYVIITYNFFQVCLATYVAKEVLVASSSYRLICEPMHSTATADGFKMASAIWFFYLSKYIDLIDTLFIIVKGNTRQMSVLHVFHHSLTLFFTWLLVRHVPTGHIFLAVILNSFVHILMYSYFLLTCLGDWIKPYLKWKRYLTAIQIIQFVIIEMHTIIALVLNCPYPPVLMYISLVYVVALFVLFANFYIRNYNMKQKKVD